MNQAVRVLQTPIALVPTHVRGVKEQIADFLDVRLPNEFKLGESDNVQLFGTQQMNELMLERAPFFFIEKAVAVNNKTVWAATTMTEERSAGHFPGRPIVPLIELCKAIAQTGIVLAALQGDETQAPIAISSGESKALAKNLIEAPVRILIKVDLMSSRMGVLHVIQGMTYINGAPVGSLAKILYTLMSRDKLLKRS